jgi:hypothetical protein
MSVLHPLVTSSRLGADILLSTLSSYTLSLCSSLNVRDEIAHAERQKKLSFCIRKLLLLGTTDEKRKTAKSEMMANITRIQFIFNSFLNQTFEYARFEVFTAVTMKDAVFWDIKTPVRTAQETHYFFASYAVWLL